VRTAQPIREIRIRGSRLRLPLGLPIRNLLVDLKRLPRYVRVSLPKPGAAMSFTAGAPIGEVVARAWQSGAPPPAGGADSLYYDELPGQFGVAADIAGLRAVRFAPHPLSGSVDAARRRLQFAARTRFGDFNGFIDQLPSHVAFSLPTGSGT
jgi:hypothetical protein